MYIGFDAAHQLDHVNMVISQSFEIAKSLYVDENLTYAVAASHDVGLAEGDRELHHVYSAKFVLNDNNLKRWFSPENIKVISEAVEDHRASSVSEPRSIYGKIVADADRYIEPEMIIKRAIQYGINNYPTLDREQQYLRTLQHMNDKYSDCGYLKLWFPDSPNAKRLETLRCIIRDEMTFRNIFENLYSKLIKDMPILNEHNKHEYPPMHTAEHILNG